MLDWQRASEARITPMHPPHWSEGDKTERSSRFSRLWNKTRKSCPVFTFLFYLILFLTSQFFQASRLNPSDPTAKRRKTSNPTSTTLPDEKNVTYPFCEDSMPGFHEHVEGIESIVVSDEINTEEDNKLDNTAQTEEPTAQATPSQSCPICGRILDDMDNTAINAHLDFCLSKCAIKEATVEPPAPNHHKSPHTQGNKKIPIQ